MVSWRWWVRGVSCEGFSAGTVLREGLGGGSRVRVLRILCELGQILLREMVMRQWEWVVGWEQWV